MKHVNVSETDGIGHVTLSRPDVSNKINAEMYAELVEAFRDLGASSASDVTSDKGCSVASRPRQADGHVRSRRDLAESVRQTVKVLRDAGEPLPRREIAARLGVPTRTVNYQLAKAIKLRFVERAGYGRYQTTNVVPAF